MNEFRQKLKDKIRAYNTSRRAGKVSWFKLHVQLDPNNYKIKYKNSELELYKLILPAHEDKRFGWSAIWELIDSTKPEDFKYVEAEQN